jgi:hypothetical protein
MNQVTLLSTSFDDSVRERIKYKKNFFHLYLGEVPSMRRIRRALGLARLGILIRKWQGAPGYTRKKEVLNIEE